MAEYADYFGSDANLDNFLDQGINAAASARDKVSIWWKDSWIDYATQYALARQANQEQIELWNMMNEYNSPASQMERFKEAGLNPNLIYTQGTPGNASSAPGHTVPNVRVQPHKDAASQIQMANQVVSMISNAAQNIAGLIDSGLDIQLKKNQVYMSDLDTNLARHVFPAGAGSAGMNMANLQDKLNPLSSTFDPMAFTYFSKNGQLPQFINNYLTGVSSRQLTDFKSQYQKYYFENLLPKFNDYQQGKLDIQEIQKSLLDYQKTTMEMLPPELRGILEPLIDYLSPFMRFIFRRTPATH